MTTGPITTESGPDAGGASGASPAGRKVAVLHLVLVLGPTNSQFNEHCLPQMHQRDISICTYFTPKLEVPPAIALHPGNGRLPSFFRRLVQALKARDHDVVHAHAAQSGLILAIVLALRPDLWRYWSRTVFTVHDSWYDFGPGTRP